MRRAGSPGMTRRTTNASTVTPQSESSARPTRPSRYRTLIQLRPGHILREDEPLRVRVVHEVLLHDDRHHHLVERDDVAALHHVAGGLLGRGDAFALVGLSEDRIHLRVHVGRLPDLEGSLVAGRMPACGY